MKTTHHTQSRLWLAVAALVAASLVSPAQAVTEWTGTSSTNWNDGANWSPSIPGNGDIAIFRNTVYANAPTLNAGSAFEVNGLNFGDGTTASAALSIASAATATVDQKTSTSVISGSSIIPIVSTSGLSTGQLVTGTRILPGTTITAINGNEITISQPTSGGTLSSGTQLTFTSVIQVGGGGIEVATGIVGGLTLTAPIVMTANQVWTNGSTLATSFSHNGIGILNGSTATLKGVANSNFRFPNSNAFCGSGGLIIETEGIVNFGSGTGGRPNNPFDGGVVLNAGRLVLNGGNTGGAGGAGALGTGVLTINGGDINGGGNIGGHPLTISGQIWNTDWTYVGSKNLDMGSGWVSLGTAAGTTRTITVNGGWITLLIGGSISNGTTAVGLAKLGSAILELNATNAYTGTTTVGEGTLRLGVAGSIVTSPMISISSGAIFNVEALSNFILQAPQVLKGSGTVVGNVQVAENASIAPGDGIGTLTVTGNVTFEDGAKLQLDVAGESTDRLSVTGTISGTGMVVVSVTANNPELPLLVMTGSNIAPLFRTNSSDYILVKNIDNTELWLQSSPGTLFIIR
jgi:autotransporter-associated beta strand protein